MNTAQGIGSLIRQAIINEQPVKTRLAPTPSGYLHRGNLYNLILNWWLARATGGKVLLRIDDLDRERVRPEYVDFIFRCLDWLELDWDEGPGKPDDLQQQWSQEHRMPMYRALMLQLKDRNLLYACTCSRNTLSKKPCDCRTSTAELSGREYSLKLVLPEQAVVYMQDALIGSALSHTTPLEDPVIWKKNDSAAYHLCSVSDDLYFGVSHILRGEDLFISSLIQQQLSQLAGLTAFGDIQIGHHPLIYGPEGAKLSKSAGSRSVMPELQQNQTLFLREFALWAGIPKSNEIQRLRDILQIAVDKS
ncbi:MAG: hypothetical protein KJS92_09320 [Bacteroidetes bacterium]|nr:hypothetical protein [Bacteroidota bacterium]